MALKTFNVDDELYKRYSSHCKEHGISMSKQVEKFIREEIEKLNKNNNSFAKLEGVDFAGKEKHHNMSKYC
jgi:negative regulator of replication initiation